MPNDDKPVMKQKEKPRPGFFKRYEIITLVSHDSSFKAWDDWLKALNDGLKSSDKPPEYALKFRKTSDKDSSSSISTFPNQKTEDTKSLVYLQLDLQADEESAGKKWLKSDQNVIRAVSSLNGKASTTTSGVTLLAAAPNWLMTGAPHTLSGGGSGGLPVPENEKDPSPDKYHFNKSQIDELIKSCGGSTRRVDVVIFDTVPPQPETAGQQQETAAEAIFQGIQANPIAVSLTPQLEIHRAGEVGITLPLIPENPGPVPGYGSKDNYDMSAHGTFIAGIINDFVPDLKIHLVEVLNQYGVGATDIFADSLRVLADNFLSQNGQIIPNQAEISKDNWSLVVNCSLCIDFPPPNEKGQIELPYHDEDGNPTGSFVLLSRDLLLAPARTAWELFKQVFQGYDVQIVAAAGNEGRKKHEPPPACYPAAFDGVLGVGALEADGTRAWYSNLADNPSSSGVVVFGGKGDSKSSSHLTAGKPDKEWSETDSSGGILGVYVAKFPHADPDGDIDESQSTPSSGWGRWSGTSFSTAIMSGILARAACKGCTVSINENTGFYQQLASEPLTFPTTNYGEIIISAPQG